MEPKKESPRFILILGSLFLLAYAAYNLGTAWMDSIPGNSLTSIELAQNSAPLNLSPSVTPTNVPLRWITPTSINAENYPVPETTHNPNNATAVPETDEAYPGMVENAYPASEVDEATSTPTIAPTTASVTLTATPTPTPTLTPANDGSYPGPGDDNDPYPGPQGSPTPTETVDGGSYPGPDKTATPAPTLQPTATTNTQQPTPTSPAQSSTPSVTPNPQTTLPSGGTPPPIITTLAYTETQIISNGSVKQAVWLDDEVSLALATSNGLYLHDLSTGRSQILDARFSMSSVAFNPNDGWIVAGGQDAAIRIWDINDGSFVTRLTGHLLGVIRLEYSQLMDFLASASDDATVRIWDYDGTPIYTFHDPVTRVKDMDVSSDGQLVAAASNRHVHIWNPNSGELSKTISQPIGWYTAAAFNPNNQILSTAFDGRRLEFWSTITWERINFLSLDTEVLSLAYSPDGRWLAIGFEDSSIQILDTASLFLLADFAGHSDLTSMAFSPTSDQLLTSSADGSIRIWDVSPLLNP